VKGKGFIQTHMVKRVEHDGCLNQRLWGLGKNPGQQKKKGKRYNFMSNFTVDQGLDRTASSEGTVSGIG